MADKWIPHGINDWPTEVLVEHLRRWSRNPASEPEIERWYRSGTERPFAQRKLTREEIEFRKYSPLFETARQWERQKREDEALAVYMNILSHYEPIGTAYYERHAILLERWGCYEEALKVCMLALRVITTKSFNADPEQFHRRIDRLYRKITKSARPEGEGARTQVSTQIRPLPVIVTIVAMESSIYTEGWLAFEMPTATEYTLTDDSPDTGAVKVVIISDNGTWSSSRQPTQHDRRAPADVAPPRRAAPDRARTRPAAAQDSGVLPGALHPDTLVAYPGEGLRRSPDA